MLRGRSSLAFTVFAFVTVGACTNSTQGTGTDAGVLDGAGSSGASPGGSSGSSSDAASPQDTYINATLGPQAGNSQLCSMLTVGPAVTIGSFRANTKPTVVSDNGTDKGGTVNTMCQVTGGSGGFDINVTATTTGAATSTALGGGVVNVVGHVDGTGTGTNLHTVISTNQVTWTGATCTVTPMYGGGPVPQSPPIAAGRVWAHVSCPSMTPDNGVRVNVNGMQVMQQCDGEADFLFENCFQ
jgi:hypothetical protein